MVSGIRNIEEGLGDGIKRPMPSELLNLEIVRKSIVAGTEIKKGELLTAENLTTKRPGRGLSPIYWDSVLGTQAKRSYLKDEFIEL
jgi:sialic acid synthase SpsE